MGEPREHPLFLATRQALDGLRDLPELPDLAIRIEIVWAREPFAVGHGGDAAALIELLWGGPVLTPRPAGGPPIRIRRGPVARARGRRADGSAIEHVRPERRDDAEVERDARGRRDAAHVVLADREVALERLVLQVPAFATAPPRGWRVLLWPIWWLLAWLHRRVLAQRVVARSAVEVARSEARASDEDLADLGARARREEAAHAAAVRALITSRDLVAVELEVTDDRFATGVDLCELGDPTAQLDAILDVSLGDLDDLDRFAAAARAMRRARRACKTIVVAQLGLDDQLACAEEAFAERIAKLERQRIAEPARFIAEQLAQVHPQIVTSVSAVIEHASVHLGAELAALGEEWIRGIADSASGDALKQTITRIETTAAVGLQRIADETRKLVLGGGGGCAYDLYPDLIAPLQARGLPADPHARRSAPALPALVVLPLLATAALARLSGQWFGDLFRSFETRRSEVRERTHAQIEQLRELAHAELLDVEPRLHAAIEQALAPQLVAACERQARAIATALAGEHAAIAGERERLAPVVEQRDRAHAILRQLRTQLAGLEAAIPACAAASLAVADPL
ncbi:MAG: hypothetical protein ABI678_04295 [Kofleriaceae bacterium]